MVHQYRSKQKTVMKLTLLRHGETVANRDRLVLGRSNVPLTELGVLQAAKAAHKLSRLSINAIYCSPYQRAIQTASYVSEETGLTTIPIQGLREMDSGEMEGIKMDEMHLKYPDYIEKWNIDPSNTRPPGGDTMAEVHQRAWNSVIHLSRSHIHDHVLAVTHLFPIQGILCKISETHSDNYEHFKIDLGSLTTVVIEPDDNSIININETSHLNSV